jgi:hypothetical protein
MMTSFAFIFGLVPLVIAQGAGDKLPKNRGAFSARCIEIPGATRGLEPLTAAAWRS